jgi:EAL domain-containing protein (putative c-di-GMP-specific phosphodiesterase class I)
VLCEAIIFIAHKLGLEVIAEGIETTEQRDLLISLDCDYGQGYLFSKPLNVSDFEQFMLKNKEGLFRS